MEPMAKKLKTAFVSTNTQRNNIMHACTQAHLRQQETTNRPLSHFFSSMVASLAKNCHRGQEKSRSSPRRKNTIVPRPGSRWSGTGLEIEC